MNFVCQGVKAFDSYRLTDIQTDGQTSKHSALKLYHAAWRVVKIVAESIGLYLVQVVFVDSLRIMALADWFILSSFCVALLFMHRLLHCLTWLQSVLIVLPLGIRGTVIALGITWGFSVVIAIPAAIKFDVVEDKMHNHHDNNHSMEACQSTWNTLHTSIYSLVLLVASYLIPQVTH